MKHFNRVILAVLTLVCLLTSLMPVSSFAKDREYVVRFFADNVYKDANGKQGKIGYISGSAVKDSTGNYSVPSVTINNDSYYLKGFVESGKDPRSFYSDAVTPTGDTDYVAVFGVKGSEVAYTVRYMVYGTTTQLDQRTFYAGIGDRPISSYIYIDGYVPYLRSQKTLVADPSQNILFCYYTAPAAPAATTTAAAGAAVAGAGAAVAGGNAAGGAANAAAAGANAANPVQANPANPGQANATNPGVAVAGANAVNPNAAAPAQQQYAQTEDILDLDVPLAAPEGSAAPVAPAAPAVSAPPVVQPQTSNKTGLPTWALVGGGAVGVGLIALLYWYLLFYRKKKKYADIDDLFDGK